MKKLVSSLLAAQLLLVFSSLPAFSKTFDLKGSQPISDLNALVTGLAAEYAYQRFQHIDELITWQRFEAGAPVHILNREAVREPVLTSSVLDEVGARLTGLIHFAQTGLYDLRITSDDGIRLSIDNQVIFDDPLRHQARVSPIIKLRVLKPGWYPVTCLFFQVEQDWQLRIDWKTPSDTAFRPLPAPVLAHLKRENKDVNNAKLEAEAIIAAARQEALRILTEARKQAAELHKNGDVKNNGSVAPASDQAAEAQPSTPVPISAAKPQVGDNVEATPVPAKQGKPSPVQN